MSLSDDKDCKTDVADTKQLFWLIQSIPSPKAEPFKLRMAQVAVRLDARLGIVNLAVYDVAFSC